VERGIGVCAPVHDAFLIEARIDDIDHAVSVAQQAMADASAFVLGGFRLRTEARIVRYPDRYADPRRRGEYMWTTVTQVLRELLGIRDCAPVQQDMSAGAHPPLLLSVS
jgi:hypothetical protein